MKSRQKGSILVFSLIILSLMLVTSLTLLSSVVLDEKASLATGSSTRSFQVADSGIEEVLYQVYKVKDVDVTELQTFDDLASAVGASCSHGVITSSEGWLVVFYEGVDGDSLMDLCSETDWRARVMKIKSQSSLSGTTRAVEVSVEPPPIP
jgi:hypothetical protein